MQSYPPFELVKLQLELGSRTDPQPSSLTAKGSFLSSVHRAKRSSTSDNLRYNISMPAKPHALRAYDFFSEQVARLCNLQLGLSVDQQTSQPQLPSKINRSYDYFSSSASPGQNRQTPRNQATRPRPRLAGGALSHASTSPPGGSPSQQKSANPVARREDWAAEARKFAFRHERGTLVNFRETELKENNRHTRAAPGQTLFSQPIQTPSPFVEAGHDFGGSDLHLARTGFHGNWKPSAAGRDCELPRAIATSMRSRQRAATPPPASEGGYPDKTGSLRSEGGSPYFL